MKEMLKNEIARELELREKYAEARKNNDEAEKQAIRKAHMELKGEILEQGNGYHRVFELGLEAAERGNEYIDIHDCLYDQDVAPLLDSLREAGAERITFSSTWSSSAEIGWLFLQNGCKLEGMVEVNGDFRYDFDGNGYFEKRHGYLYSL